MKNTLPTSPAGEKTLATKKPKTRSPSTQVQNILDANLPKSHFINFMDQEIEGNFIGPFFMQKTTRRGFCNIMNFLTSGELKFSEICALQSANINWLPVDCSDIEGDKIKTLIQKEDLQEVVTKAIRFARKLA